MISPQGKLSLMVSDQTNSLLCSPRAHPLSLTPLLRQQLTQLTQDYECFKEKTIAGVREWMGRVSTLVYRQAREKMILESELEKSKQVQQSMRSQVIQLKEMINQAMNGYAKELQTKNQQIKQLQQQLQQRVLDCQRQREVEEKLQKDEQELEIIQEESEQATFSSASLREFKQDDRYDQRLSPSLDSKQQSRILVNEQSPNPILENSPILQNSSRIVEIEGSPLPATNESLQKPIIENNLLKSEHKRTKSFIDNFRKTIEESFHERNKELNNLNKQPIQPLAQKIVIQITNEPNQPEKHEKGIVKSFFYKSPSDKQNLIERENPLPLLHLAPSQPLRELANFQQHHLDNRFYTHSVKHSYINPQRAVTEPNDTDVSVSNNTHNTFTEDSSSQVFQIKCLQTPTNVSNVSLFKKRDQQHLRVMTEPSPQRLRPHNCYFTTKPAPTPSPAPRKPSADRAHSQQEGKIAKGSLSKQKIKVTSRLLDQMAPHSRKPSSSNLPKPLVYLGGKSLFRKFLIELKLAFKKYTINVGSSCDQVKYEGEKRNKQRWGRGKLYYRSGAVYEGDFKDNLRHGRGSLVLNGISIFEGEWVCDRLQGQGYLKSMKCMSGQCPGVFNQASFCGNISENRFHGIGTIFLNSKEKIVTKFSHGVPIGELTYYNLHEIQFGVWPSD